MLSYLVFSYFCFSVFSQKPTESVTWSNESFYSKNRVESPYFIFLNNDKSQILLCNKDLNDKPSSGKCIIGDLDLQKKMVNFGSSYIYMNENATDNYQMLEPDTKSFILSFTNADSSSMGPGKALQGNIQSDGSIKFNSLYTYNTGYNDQSRLIYLTSTSFIVCYSVGTLNRESAYCRLSSYTTKNGSLTFDLDYMVHEGGRINGMAVRRLNEKQFLICFARDPKQIGVCYIGTVNNDKSITYSKDSKFNEKGGTDKIDIGIINDNTILVCYVSRNDGACSIGTMSTNNNVYSDISFSSKTRYSFLDRRIDETSSILLPPNTINNSNYLVLVCYVDLGKGRKKSKGVCQFGEISKNYDDIVYGDQVGVFNKADTDRVQLELVSDNVVLLCYSTKNVNGSCRIGVIN